MISKSVSLKNKAKELLHPTSKYNRERTRQEALSRKSPTTPVGGPLMTKKVKTMVQKMTMMLATISVFRMQKIIVTISK